MKTFLPCRGRNAGRESNPGQPERKRVGEEYNRKEVKHISLLLFSFWWGR